MRYPKREVAGRDGRGKTACSDLCPDTSGVAFSFGGGSVSAPAVDQSAYDAVRSLLVSKGGFLSGSRGKEQYGGSLCGFHIA